MERRTGLLRGTKKMVYGKGKRKCVGGGEGRMRGMDFKEKKETQRGRDRIKKRQKDEASRRGCLKRGG